METRRAAAAVGFTVGLFVVVQLGALALVGPFERAGYQQVENPTDPTNSVVYIGAILVLTAVMLAIIRLDVEWVLRAVLILTSGFLSLYAFTVVVPPVVVLPVGGVAVNILAWVAAAALAVALVAHPDWYVIDAAGVVIGASAAALFGISFGVLPAVVLLAALAVYDTISVYGTEHMLSLASGVMDLKVPIILVIPLSPSYSFLEEDRDVGPEGPEDEGDGAANGNEPEEEDLAERDAFFIGLGDAVMPTVMVASAAVFAPAAPLVAGLALNLPALTAMVGTLLGLVVLLGMVMQGRAHAGLPLLNGGAIGGYLVGALASGIPLVQALGLGPYL